MSVRYTLTWAINVFFVLICWLSVGPAPVQGQTVQDAYALRAANGQRISQQLDFNDTLTLNGRLYAAGPPYSPRQTCGTCHDYDAVTRAYHFRTGAGPVGETLSDHWSDREQDSTLYRYLARSYAYLESPGMFGSWCPVSFRQLAAKESVGKSGDPVITEGRPQWFDLGSYEENQLCCSCHPGGGTAEGLVQADGSVAPYDSFDPAANATHSFDRDFFSYSTLDIVKASFAESIAEAVSDVGTEGKPESVPWHESGVIEADCMLCHVDPDSPFVLRCADGMKVFPNRPRFMIFAQRGEDGNVTRISIGTPLVTGFHNESALNYTDHTQRVRRPARNIPLADLPEDVLYGLMRLWKTELERIEASGRALPFALYGENVAKIWTGSEIRPEYCVNPYGVSDEMARLQANEGALKDMFTNLLAFMQAHGYPGMDIGGLHALLFNDFIYAYEIINPEVAAFGQSPEELMSFPVPLRAYEPGKFYSDLDNPHSSIRDYLRAPLVEGQGMQYVGRPGLTWSAWREAIRSGSDTAAVLNAFFSGGQVLDGNVSGVLHQYLPSFFNVMPSAGLMGLDLDQDGSPLCYIQLVKDDSDNWSAKTYWEVDEVTYQSLHKTVSGGAGEADSPRWIRVCGQCHIMTLDHEAGVEQVRAYNFGMAADWVKNGLFINETDDKDAAGFDVHMSTGDQRIGCGACHLRQSGFHTSREMEDLHNFLKGTDTAHMVRNDLDNAYRAKTCERCHLTDREGLDPEQTVAAHRVRFGVFTDKHLEDIACESCHVPFRKTWRFRALDYTLGYFANFDNRAIYDILSVEQDDADFGKIRALPGELAVSPAYSLFPAYGSAKFCINSQHIDADPVTGTVSMDYVTQMVNYLHMTAEADPGAVLSGMALNPRFDLYKYLFQQTLDSAAAASIPISYDPKWDNMSLPVLYWVNGRNGYPQIRPGNPIFVMAWVDMNAAQGGDAQDLAFNGARMLYVRELNAAIREYQFPTRSVADAEALSSIPPNADPSSLGVLGEMAARVILKDSNYIIYDHTGDMYPDLWYTEDVRAMQQALRTVLQAEGVSDPMPMLLMTARFFTDSHGVQPKEFSLGTRSCNDCHNRMDDITGQEVPGEMPGAHRTADRVITFLPWQPPWFSSENIAWSQDDGGGIVPTGENGTDGQGAFFIIDPEISYISKMNPNNVPVLGTLASDILERSSMEAGNRFYLNGSDQVKGYALPGVNQMFLTEAEKEAVYVNQIATGPDDLFFYNQIPLHLKPSLKEFGYVPFKQKIQFRAGRSLYSGDGYIFRLGVEHYNGETIFLYLPLASRPYLYQWAFPMLVKQDAPGMPWHRVDAGPWECARIVGAFPGYVKIKVYGANGGSGRYAAVYATLDRDADGDGFVASEDCDDSNPAINPGAVDVCNDDGVDDDCDGVAAYVDGCGVCDEDPDNDGESCADCAGVPGGSSRVDACGVCGGDNSTCTDCAGVINGANVTDMCGNCVLPEHSCLLDCNGVWGGRSYTDNCGTCDDNASNDCASDCRGVWGGDYVINQCGHCVNGEDSNCTRDCGGAWHSPLVQVNYVNPCGECVNATTDLCERDCAGVWGGNATFDSCGICVGGTTGKEPCDVVIGGLVWQANDSGDALLHDEVFGVDGNTTCDRLVASGHDDWRLPTVQELKSIYSASTPNHLAPGLQGHIAPYWSSEASVNGTGQWGVDFTDNSSSVYVDDALYVRCVRCGANGAYEDGCGVCDADPENDNATCGDCAGIPYGNTEYDACGVCGGDNSTCRDCAGVVNGANITDMCGNCVLPENACEQDCAGVWGGNATEDNCGVCDSNASNDCEQDCAGIWGGESRINECGHCVSGEDANCTQDCGGVWHSPELEVYYVNPCGQCVNATTDVGCEQDCAGVWGGNATFDSCGICAGGTTGRTPCEKEFGNLMWQANDNGPLTHDEVFDPEGLSTCDRLVASGYQDWRLPTVHELKSIYAPETSNHHLLGLVGHIAPYWSSDESGNGTGQWGVDFTDNSSSVYVDDALYVRCVRCGGNGAYEDGCGVCDADPSNDNATCGDCAGIPYGTTGYDACGVCGGDNSTCRDCAGVVNGANVTDMCGNCVLPENACEQDCAGVWGGHATEDNCGVCDSNASNDCEQDCSGVWGGESHINECGHCVSGDDANCTQDCGGLWHSPEIEIYYVNQCGQCVNATTDSGCEQDCAGVWGGNATFDSCGMCVGGTTGREPCEVAIGNLMWQANDRGPFLYQDVFDADGNSTCDRMVASGYDDWRLPTVDELQSIYSSSTLNHHLAGLVGHLAPYWSADESDNGTGQWGVDFADNSTAVYVDQSLYCRCVRSVR